MINQCRSSLVGRDVSKKTLLLGQLLLILLNVFSLYSIYRYASIAESVMHKGFLGHGYPHYGVDAMFYNALIPTLLFLSLMAVFIKAYLTKEPRLSALWPFVTAVFLYTFLGYVDNHFNAAQGSNLLHFDISRLVLIFSLTTLWALFREVKDFIQARSSL